MWAVVMVAGLVGMASWLRGGATPKALNTTHAAMQRVAYAQTAADDVAGLYEEKCSLCHGLDRRGKPPVFPTLVGVSQKYSDAQITDQIRHGKGRMPAYPGLSDAEVASLVALLKTPPPAEATVPGDGAQDKPQQFLRASLTEL